MTIKYWSNFSKRKNSTKQPTGGTSLTVVLKDGTSIEKPTFLVTGNLFSCNYVEAFGHYYFVDDVKSVRNNLTEISCSMDVLATFKSEIGSYNAYIERAADSTYYDVMYPDTHVAIKNEEEVVSTVFPSSFVWSEFGLYVLSVLNNLGSGAGFTTYYLMDAGNMRLLAEYLNQDWGAGLTDFVAFLQANFLHTADAVISCKWVPLSIVSIPQTGTSWETIKVGTDIVSIGGVDVKGYRVTTTALIAESEMSLAIPHIYNDFRKAAPYTSGKLYIPMYGMVDFNPLDFSKNDTIYADIYADWVTGDIAVLLRDDTAANSGKVVSSYTYNCSVDCPVGQAAANVSGFMASGLGLAASAALAVGSSGATAVAGAFGAAVSGMNTLSNAVVPTMSVRGGQGGRAIAAASPDFIITLIIKHTSDPLLCVCQGRPVMGYLPLNSFTGYVKCLEASVEIPGMSAEKDEVNSFLNSGFYYE